MFWKSCFVEFNKNLLNSTDLYVNVLNEIIRFLLNYKLDKKYLKINCLITNSKIFSNINTTTNSKLLFNSTNTITTNKLLFNSNNKISINTLLLNNNNNLVEANKTFKKLNNSIITIITINR